MPRRRRVSWHATGRWYFTHTDSESKRRSYYASPEIPHTDAGQRKAQIWMDDKLNELADRVITDNDWTLDDLRLAYLTWCTKQVAGDEKSEHTLRGHRGHLHLICSTARGARTYGDIVARDLTTRIVAELVESWQSPGKDKHGKPKRIIGPVTIGNRIGSLVAVLNWASKPRDDRPISKLIESNPIAGYQSPRIPYQGDRYAPSTEIDKFQEWVDSRAMGKIGRRARFERMTALLIRVASETGCRPGELCVLQWEHLKEEQRAIILPPRLHKTGRKTGKPRIIVLSRDLIARLQELRKDPHRHPTHVFTHQSGSLAGLTDDEARQGMPWNSTALAKKVLKLRRAAIKADVLQVDSGVQRMHLYRLRHTKITNDLQGGANAMDVAKMAGNSVKVIEDTYLHTQVEHLVEVQDWLDKQEGTAKK